MNRRSLWIDRDHRRDGDHGPFSSARWRRQAEAAEERRRGPEEPPPPPPEPKRRRGWLLSVATLAVALAVLTLAVFAVVGGDDQAATLSAPVDGRPLPATSAGRVAESAGPGVVSVRAGQAGGTGFVVRRDGTIVTNAHVVGSNDTALVRFNDTGQQIDAEVLGTDQSSDLAVLRVDPGSVDSLRVLPLADSDKVRVGDDVVAIGHPLGLDRTVTAGIVSGTGREIQAPDGFQIDEVIQTDAPINQGNSGGPLLDARGRVVGVNSQIATAGSAGNVGIGFAVPANTVKEVVPQLSRGEPVRRPYLGVATTLGSGGAAVGEVTPGGPADAAGLRAGDVITSIDGREVTDPDDVAEIVSDHQPGDEVEIELERGGEKRTIGVELSHAAHPHAVSFQAPLFLLALLALPLLAVLYLLVDRRRKRAAAGFASPLLAPSFAPLRPGFRRHAPILAYALAVAIAAIALARPEATVAVPEERAAVVLATDISGSMEAGDVAPSRMAAVREAAADFVDGAPSELRVGAVAFNHAVQAIEPPSPERQGVRDLIERMRPSGGTATGKALTASLSLLRQENQRPSERAPGAVILLSDGTSTHGLDPLPVAREAGRARVPVYTVALGTDRGTIEVERPGGGTETRRVPPDRNAMQRIATLSGGRTFSAEADDELATVYEQLGSRIATREERREVTAAFAGGAALLLLLGGGMSLRWFGRLP